MVARKEEKYFSRIPTNFAEENCTDGAFYCIVQNAQISLKEKSCDLGKEQRNFLLFIISNY